MKPTPVGAVRAVFRHELRLLFLSPAAWVFLAAFQVLAGAFFLIALGSSGEASLRVALPNWAVTLVFCVPLITMRQLAEERRSGTLELLWTVPVPLAALILGKWLATCALCGVLLLLTAPIPAVLWLYGDPDLGVLCTTYLGLALCCASFAAAGLFTSSLTSDPTVAGVLGVLVLMPFWLAGAVRDLVPGPARSWVDRVSLGEHLRSFATGAVDTGDLAWFIGFCGLFLFLTWRALEARRWA